MSRMSHVTNETHINESRFHVDRHVALYLLYMLYFYEYIHTYKNQKSLTAFVDGCSVMQCVDM